MNRSVVVLGFVVGALVSGCWSGQEPGPGGVDRARSTVEVDRTDGVVADGADAAVVEVLLRDEAERPLPGVAVQLQVSGQGSRVEGDSETDAAGVARLQVTSTVAETKLLTVVVGEGMQLSAQPSVRFVPGAAARLSFAVPPGAVAAGQPLAPAVQVAVEDAQGNLVDSEAVVSVAIEEGPEGAELVGTMHVAAVGGRATFANLRLARLGTYRLSARAEGLPPAVSPSFEVTVGPPAWLVMLSQPEAVVAGEAFSLQVALQDALGNPLPTATNEVQLAVATGPVGATLGGTLRVAAVEGVATFDGLTLQRAGPAFLLAATAAGMQGGISAPFAVLPAAPSAATSSLSVTPSSVVADGVAQGAVQLLARDAFGNDVMAIAVTLEATGEENSLSAEEGLTDHQGRFTAALTSTRAEEKTVTATVGGLSLPATVTFAPGAPAVATSTFSASPSSALANGSEAIALTLTLRDAHDNPVPGQAVALSSSGSDDTLSPAAGETDGAGVFTSSLSSTRGEEKTLTATFGEGSLTTTVTFIPVATHLAFAVQPQDGSVGAPLAPAVQVRLVDAHGSLASTATHAVTIGVDSDPAGATLSGTVTVNAVGGVAIFDNLVPEAGGTYRLEASSAGLSPATSDAFEVERFRLISLSASRSSVQVGEAALLSWTTNGLSPVGGLMLEPDGTVLSGESPHSVTPFPSVPTGPFPRHTYTLREAGADLWAGWAGAQRVGSAGSASVTAIAALPDGGALVTGSFEDAATFGAHTLTSTGGTDVFLVRLAADGTVVWASSAGGSEWESATGIAALSDGGALVTGSFQGTATFDTHTLTSAGDSDVFVARYGAEGGVVWAQRAGGGLQDLARSVVVLPDGEALVTGDCSGTVTFGTHTTEGGESDTFVAKVAADGSVRWVQRYGGAAVEVRSAGLAVLPDGGWLLAGDFSGTVHFGPHVLSSTGSSDTFVARFAADGRALWAQRGGGADSWVRADRVAALPEGGGLMVGSFSGSVSFGSHPLIAAGREDAFVVKFSSDGAVAWAKTVSGPAWKEVREVVALADGGALVMGLFQSSVGFGTHGLTSASGTDVFLVQYAADGSVRWVMGGGSWEGEHPVALAALPDGGALVAGADSAGATFGSHSLPSEGSPGVFLARMEPGNFRQVSIEPEGVAWVQRAEGNASAGRAVAALPDGGMVVTGDFQGAAAFGDVILTSAGGNDIFVARYTADGAVEWARRAGGSAADFGMGVTALPDGGVVVTGYFQGTATFGSHTLTPEGGADIFVVKYTADGEVEWAQSAGSSAADIGYAVTALPDGGVVVTGYFQGTASFGTHSLTSAGGTDVFLAKYAADGTVAWARRAGGPSTDVAYAVTALPDGGVAVAGSFLGEATFGAHSLTSAGSSDIFVARFAADGTPVWARRAGGALGDVAQAVTALPDGAVVVTGYFQGTATLGPHTLTSAGGSDVFVARFAADGTVEWVRSAGGSSGDIGYGVVALPDGGVVVTGQIQSTATFGAHTLTSAGSADVFLAKYAANGALEWAQRAGGSSADFGYGVVALKGGGVTVTGTVSGTAVFGAHTVSGSTPGAFTARYFARQE